MFIYLFLHFSMCMLHQFAILFTVMWLCNFEAVGAGEVYSKRSWFLGGRGGCLEASKTCFSWKARRARRQSRNFITMLPRPYRDSRQDMENIIMLLYFTLKLTRVLIQNTFWEGYCSTVQYSFNRNYETNAFQLQKKCMVSLTNFLYC